MLTDHHVTDENRDTGAVLYRRKTLRKLKRHLGVENEFMLPARAEEAVVRENLLLRAPAKFTEPREECMRWMGALPEGVEAISHALSLKHVGQLRKMTLEHSPEAFRRALIGDPPAQVKLMVAWEKAGAGFMRARSRAYSLDRTAWLTEHVRQLEAEGKVHRNSQAHCSSVIMAMQVPPGVLNFTGYYQAIMADMLDGPIGRTFLGMANDAALWTQEGKAPLN